MVLKNHKPFLFSKATLHLLYFSFSAIFLEYFYPQTNLQVLLVLLSKRLYMSFFVKLFSSHMKQRHEKSYFITRFYVYLIQEYSQVFTKSQINIRIGN